MLAEAILRKTKVISKSRTLQHAFALLFGKAGVQAIALLSHPILARLYSPAQFGEFALLNSILAILLIVSCGRYEAAIVLSKRLQHAKRLFQLSQLILLIFSGLLFLLLILVPFGSLPGLTEIAPIYLWLLPILVLFTGYWQIVQNWLIKLRKFNQISLSNIIQRLLIFSGALLGIFFQTKLNGLIVGLVIGAFGIFIIAICHQTQSIKVPISSIKNYASHFRDFPLYSVPTLFLNLISFHLPVLWISYYFNSNAAGSFSLALMLISLPYTSICISIAPVFYERMAIGTKSLQQKILIKTCLVYGAFSMALAIILFLWGELISIWLLGSNWEQTGTILVLLSPLVVFQGTESWLMISLNVFRRQDITLRMQALKLFLWCSALGTSSYYGELLLSFKLMSLFSILHLIFLIYIVCHIRQKRNDKYSNRTLAKT